MGRLTPSQPARSLVSTKFHIRLLAFGCAICPVCICARKWPLSAFAKAMARLEKRCPMCRAYRVVHASPTKD